jgi:alanine dehydrogenase
MKFGIIRERKNPPDRRVVFSPSELLHFKKRFPEAEIAVERSDIRIFKDEEYQALGFELVDDLTSCDVIIGVKEVPAESLLPNKKYFFFSHTIKEQPYNLELLQAILEKNIDLYDHETIVDVNNKRLIGFGRYAGNVGAYNGIRTFGIKYDLFQLPKAETLNGRSNLVEKLKRLILPPIKVVVTGTGKVGSGVKEILDAMKMKEVSLQDFLKKKYDAPVYTQIEVEDYYKRKDGGTFVTDEFYANSTDFTSDFEKFSQIADIFMAGHFYAPNAPFILTNDMLKSAKNNIKVVADISCDVNGPVACTIKASTIANPIFGYLPSESKEVDMFHPGAISVMSIDNLPCELPRDASEGFGEMFNEHVMSAFFNNDKDGILHRAQITDGGNLTERFKYLQDFVNQK